MYHRNWQPSKAAAKEFVQKMGEIEEFCRAHEISVSAGGDSYYFELNGVHYRISNHSIEASNSHAYDEYGRQIREKYHPDQRRGDVVYIHAGKTRIIQIYNDLAAGKKLDGRGKHC